MKITVKMKCENGHTWRGAIGNKKVTACASDVTLLFAMKRVRTATFEISNGRPRVHEDYHVFEFNKWGHYGLIEVTPGQKPSITTRTSQIIRNAFLAKKQKISPIYVAVL